MTEPSEMNKIYPLLHLRPYDFSNLICGYYKKKIERNKKN